MIKKSLTMFVVISVFLVLSAMTVYGSEISIYIDGQKIETDQPPVVENGRTLVPFRQIGQSLGGNVIWNEKERLSTITYTNINNQEVAIYIDLGEAAQRGFRNYYYYTKTIGDNTSFYSMDVRPELINDYLYLPLRACCEALDCKVEWDANTNSIYITKKTDISSSSSSSKYVANTFADFYNKIDAGEKIDSNPIVNITETTTSNNGEILTDNNLLDALQGNWKEESGTGDYTFLKDGSAYSVGGLFKEKYEINGSNIIFISEYIGEDNYTKLPDKTFINTVKVTIYSNVTNRMTISWPNGDRSYIKQN